MADKGKYNKRRSNYHFQSRRRRKPTHREFGRAGQDILNKYGGFGENPDAVIATKGMDYLTEIERDTHLSSSLATRRQELIKRGWRIVPSTSSGNDRPSKLDIEKADFVRDQLIDMAGSFEKDLEGMLDAIGKGFSLTEINYTDVVWRGQSMTGLKNLRYKDPAWFAFKYDKLGYFRINQIDPDPGGVELPTEKFIHIIMGPNDENPYGRSVDAEVAFWCWVKKNIAKFWAIFAEKFGMPLSVIELPRNIEKDSPEYTKAEEILAAVQEETGIIVPDGFVLKFLEAVRNGEAGYERFIEICNKEISKRVFGATLIAEEGKRGQGSYALGSEHSERFEGYVTFDAAVLEAALNESLIRRLIDYNYDTDFYPRFEFVEFSPGMFITFSQSLYNLAQSGLEIPKKWAYEKLKIPVPRKGEEVLEIKQQTPIVPQQGPDNKIDMRETSPPAPLQRGESEWQELFKEYPELEQAFKSIDRLNERYQAIYADEVDKAIASIKKKSIPASGSCCGT